MHILYPHEKIYIYINNMEIFIAYHVMKFSRMQLYDVACLYIVLHDSKYIIFLGRSTVKVFLR